VNLRRVIEESDTKLGRLFDLCVQTLVLISLISFSVETLPDSPAQLRRVLRWIEVGTVCLFTVEYALRVAVADPKRSYVFSFFGLIDLAAVLPFYLCLGIDLRAIRIVRFLRVFRILKLARYGRAIERLRRALVIVREEMILFAAAALILLYISAVGIYYFEREAQPEQFASVFHSLWWSVITLTTVGYGDVYPITAGGRMFTIFVLILGLGLVAVPTALFASALSKVRQLESSGNPPPSEDHACDGSSTNTGRVR